MIGRIEVICGPMFSGKSEELIRRLRRAQIAGKRVAAFKPEIDDRFEVEYIQSHNGQSFSCVAITDPVLIIALSDSFDVIGVDEAQFFGHKLNPVADSLRLLGKVVIIAGLDLTYKGQPWLWFPWLMAISDRIDKLSAVCTVCGADAQVTHRFVEDQDESLDDDLIMVGGKELYEARCRDHFEYG
jgi:thymidine kinase